MTKRIEVNPGKRLSLQSHKYRAECWFVFKGTATAVRGEETLTLKAGQHLSILKEQKHRLINDTNEPLIIFEVQLGDHLSEDDITRYEDDFGRK